MSNINLPAEFRSGNSIKVDRATISRVRMIEILREAIEANRNEREGCENHITRQVMGERTYAYDNNDPSGPDGYAYRYRHTNGETVLRFNNGEEVNGSKPIEAVPFWFAPQPPQIPEYHKQTLNEILACCLAWEPETRILGNVRAQDVVDAIRVMLESTPQRMDDIVIDTCDQGHKFAKLPDHPMKDGKARCPYCMAIGFDNLYKDWLIKDQLLGIILPIVDRAGDYCEEDTAENICDDLKREVSKFIDNIISGN